MRIRDLEREVAELREARKGLPLMELELRGVRVKVYGSDTSFRRE